MGDHEKTINQIETIIAVIGEQAFLKAVDAVLKEINCRKKAACIHKWTLSPILGDGYNCFKCGSWKPEED